MIDETDPNFCKLQLTGADLAAYIAQVRAELGDIDSSIIGVLP